MCRVNQWQAALLTDAAQHSPKAVCAQGAGHWRLWRRQEWKTVPISLLLALASFEADSLSVASRISLFQARACAVFAAHWLSPR